MQYRRPLVLSLLVFLLLCGGIASSSLSAKNEGSAPGANASASPSPTPRTREELPQDSDEVIKVETNLVTMPVSVLDRNGRFVSGLGQNDFQIYENGVAQKIEYFQSVEQPFTVVLLIDVSPSTAYQIEEIQDAAISFVNQLRRDDKVVVISFDERVNVLSPVTNDRRVSGHRSSGRRSRVTGR